MPHEGAQASVTAGRRHRSRRFRMLVPATPTAVRELLARAADHCHAGAVPPPVREDLLIVLAELLNNIVEHGLAGRDGGVLDLAIGVEPVGVRCELRDDGAALPDGRLPPGRMPCIEGPLANLPEGGFGLGLVRALTRELVHARVGCENRTSFLIPDSRCGTAI